MKYEEKAYRRENGILLLAYHRIWNGTEFEYIFDSGHRLNIISTIRKQVGPSEHK